jgi:hypothetical protein
MMARIVVFLLGVVLAQAALAAGGAYASEPEAMPAPEVRFEGDIAYVSGGVGRDERKAMHAMARRFNVRLNLVSAKGGEALSDVDVSVVDEHGRLRLRMRTMGPLLYLKLPDGRYQLNTAYRGGMHAVTLTAGPQPVDMIIRLPAVPGPDEWLLCKTGCSRVVPRAPPGAGGQASRRDP